MASGGWKEFLSSDKHSAVRFDVLQGQFLRFRYRPEDRHGLKAFLIVDLLTMSEVMIELYEGGTLVEQITLGGSRLSRRNTRDASPTRGASR